MGPKKRRRSKKKNESDTNTATDVCNQLVEDIDRQKHNKQEQSGESKMEAVFDKNFSDDEEVKIAAPDYMSVLSLEILCNIMNYLHLRDLLKLDHQCRKLNQAVTMHLRVKKILDFTEGELISWTSDRLSDSSLVHLFKRCQDLQYIYGFHPPFLSKRRQRGTKKLSIPGIIEALSVLKNLKGIEVSDTLVLETLFSYFPHVEILGTFRNRDGCFPVDDLNVLHIPENPWITSMHLIGIVIPKLPAMLHLKHIQLRYVHFINPQPFKDFAVPTLKSFIMANCAGPSNVLKYVPLIAGLAAARSLQRMELIRVPFLGGLLHHVVEESLRVHRFKNMQSMKFGACKHIIGMDVGFLAISSAENLEELYLQPSLTKDSLFIALKMATVKFPVFNRLSLGYIEPFQESDNWTNQDLVIEGLANIAESPATITDVGMAAVGECFSDLKFLEIYNSPHISKPTAWLSPDVNAWCCLRELVLRRCHSISLQDFCQFLPSLSVLEAIHLELMFKEPPKGCSRVGLSAGTGFGMSPMSSSLIPAPPNNPVPNQNEVNNNGIANQNEVNNNGLANNNEDGVHIADNQVQTNNANDGVDHHDNINNSSNQNDRLNSTVVNGDTNINIKENNSDRNSSEHEMPVDHSLPSTSGLNVKHCDSYLEDTHTCSTSESSSLNNSTNLNIPVFSNGHRCYTSKNITNSDISVSTSSTMDILRVTSWENPSISENNRAALSEQISDSDKSDIDLNEKDKSVLSHQLDKDDSVVLVENLLDMNTDGFSNELNRESDLFEDSNNASKKQIDNSSIKITESLNENLLSVDDNDSCLETENSSCQLSVESSDFLELKERKCESSSSLTCESNVKQEESNNLLCETGNTQSQCEIGNTHSQCETGNTHSQCEIGNTHSQCETGNTHSQCEIGNTHSQCETGNTHSQCEIGNTHSQCETGNTHSQCEIGNTHSQCETGDSQFIVHEKKDDNKICSDCNSIKHSSSSTSNLNEQPSNPSTNSQISNNIFDDNKTQQNENKLSSVQISSNTVLNDANHLHEKSNAGVLGESSGNLTKEEVVSESSSATGSSVTTRSGKSLYGKKKGLARKSQSQEKTQEVTSSMTSSVTESVAMNSDNIKDSCILNSGTGNTKKEDEDLNNTEKAISTETVKKDEDVEEIVIDLSTCKSGLNIQNNKTESKEKPYLCPVTRSKGKEQLDEESRKKRGRPKNRKRKSTSNPENNIPDQKTRVEKLAAILDVTVMTDRWCQVNINDLRRCNSTESTDSQNSCGTNGYINIVQKKKTEPVMCHKSTSTSDPVMEDDHIQILKLRSKSLQCITLNMVGITDLVVEDCPKLGKISGQACRVLKNVTVGNATKLSRVSFTQCKKLDEISMVREIGIIRSQRNRVIFLRPMNHFDGTSLERHLFSGRYVDYNICVVYDHSPEPLETLYNRVRVQSWQDLITGINSELLKNYGYKLRRYEESTGYPWNRSIYTMKGYNNNSSRWELITDIPWLRPLYEAPDLEIRGQKIKNPDDRRAGVYCPGAKGHDTIDDCITDCLPNIVDGLTVEMPLCLYSIIVYVNLCDIQGTPSFDPYV